MTKKTKVQTKKPDVLLSAFQYCLTWVKNNGRTSIIIGVVIICLALAGWGLAAYQASKDEKAQYMLSQGIKNFEEYVVTMKGDGLSKAEKTFSSLTKEGPPGVRDVARLYLARIAMMKGDKEDAKALYAEIVKKPSNDVVKKLSEGALMDMQKK
jgi:predicted negative regulator of RcsB-dependent stress response